MIYKYFKVKCKSKLNVLKMEQVNVDILQRKILEIQIYNIISILHLLKVHKSLELFPHMEHKKNKILYIDQISKQPSASTK